MEVTIERTVCKQEGQELRNNDGKPQCSEWNGVAMEAELSKGYLNKLLDLSLVCGEDGATFASVKSLC